MVNSFDHRLNQLKDYMREQAMDVSLITSPINIYYLTGFFSDPHERFMCLVVDQRKQQCTLFVPALDADAAHQASFVSSIVSVSDTDHPYELLKKHLGANVGVFWVEKKIMNLYQYEQLEEQYPNMRVQDI